MLMRVLNEREKAKQIIESKQIIGSKKDTALLVIKYYNELGEEQTKIRNNILDIFAHNDAEFNKVMNIQWVDRYVKNNKDAVFNSMEYVSISKQELEKISSVKNLNMEKVLFVMLVCAKYDKKERFKDYWYNEEVVNTGLQMFSELFKMAKISQKKETQLNILNSIVTKTDMVSMSSRTDRVGFKLNFIGGYDCEVKISSFDYDFINEYLLWKGLDLCEVCGDVIEKVSVKATSQKYCKDCSKKIKNQKNKEYYSKNAII